MRKNSGFRFEQKIKDYILKHHLADAGQTILVGLSGGPDSMCLMYVIKKLGFPVVGAHINFQLRGKESDQDESFVKNWCTTQDIPLFRTRFDCVKEAAKEKKGLEEMARKLRYQWIGKLCNSKKIYRVAMGHQLNDQAETVLFNIVRGTGINGAKGIMPMNEMPYAPPLQQQQIKLIRPLLNVDRLDIENYLHFSKIPFRNDQTNNANEFSRNKLRNQVFPVLSEINSAAVNHIAEFAFKMQGLQTITEDWKSSLFKRYLYGTTANPCIKLDEEINAFSLFYLLSPYGFNEDQVNQIFVSVMNGQKSKEFFSPEYHLITGSKKLELVSRQASHDFNTLIHRVPAQIPYLDQLISIASTRPSSKALKDQVILSAKDLVLPLKLRSWKAGDRMKPLGMKGNSKKIKDILTDKKISGLAKKNALVLESGGEIIWLYPTRVISEYVKLTEETKQAIKITARMEGN